jgi:cytochrome c-type biogenesis protein CcmH
MRRISLGVLFFSLLAAGFILSSRELPVSLTPLGMQVAQAANSAPAPTPSDDQVNAVAKQLYCPVCENIPLDVCPTQACAQWRDLIRQKLAAGWSGEQIKQYFAAQYGDRVLGVPPRQGPNMIVNYLFYVLIGVSLLTGIFVLARVLSGMRKNANRNVPQVDATSPSGAYVNRIEEDLRRLK